jgi:hypothetical protein
MDRDYDQHAHTEHSVLGQLFQLLEDSVQHGMDRPPQTRRSQGPLFYFVKRSESNGSSVTSVTCLETRSTFSIALPVLDCKRRFCVDRADKPLAKLTWVGRGQCLTALGHRATVTGEAAHLGLSCPRPQGKESLVQPMAFVVSASKVKALRWRAIISSASEMCAILDELAPGNEPSPT